MEFRDRLKMLIENKNVTIYRVSKDTGISNQLLSNYLKGISEPRKDKLNILTQYFNISTAWLLTGFGDIRPNFNEEKILDILNEPEAKCQKTHKAKTLSTDWIKIPFIPIHARASFAETFETEIHELSELTIPRLSGINYENGKVFEVDGDSMEPTLITGEQVFCEYVDPANWKYITGPVIVSFGNNMIVVKRIKENNLANGELVLWSDNEIGGKFTLSREQDQIRKMYKVRYTVYKPIR